jgi:hypothetical protein
MAFETPRNFKIESDRSLPEAMEKLGHALRVDPESRVQIEPVCARPSPISIAPDKSLQAGNAGQENLNVSAESVYSQVAARGGMFIARRIDDASLLSRQYSLVRLRLKLEECRTVIAFLQTGPQRTGPLAGVKNGITRFTRLAFNWFITPSVTFHSAAGDALNECAASLDLLSRQIQVIAQELAVLSETTSALETALSELPKNLPLKGSDQ